jgi:hypothetical protein
MDIPPPNPNLTTADVLAALHASGKPLQEWGRAIDGTPLLTARTGGDKQPAIFITAGAHSHETAGVHAALNMLQTLDTEHEVHILPLRDPFGFAGVSHCLSFATGQPIELADHRATLDYLMANGALILREGDMYAFKLGDVGFMWTTSLTYRDGLKKMLRRPVYLTRDDPEVLKALWGKRVMLIDPAVNCEGAGEMRRCFHCVLSEKGEWLHLNRFFGRDDAPPEVAAVDRWMQKLRPGLTCDLHEGHGEGFWMPKRKPKENPERVVDMTVAFFDYIQSHGYPITDYENWRATDDTPGDPNWLVPEPRVPGLFWTRGLLRGEGYNLADYAGLFGIAYGTEAPVHRPLIMRVDGITNGILAAIKVWERTV